MADSPPNFDAIFEHQRRVSSSGHQRYSSTSSSNLSVTSSLQPRNFSNGQAITAEPSSIEGRGQNASPFELDHRPRVASSSSSLRNQQNSESRQESLPWSSTMINTAVKEGGQEQAAYQQQQQPFPPTSRQYNSNNPWPANNGYDPLGLGNFAETGSPYNPPSSSSPYNLATTSSGSAYAGTPMSTGATPSGMGGFDYGQGPDMVNVKNEFMDDGMFGNDVFPGMQGQGGSGTGSGFVNGDGGDDGTAQMEGFMEDLLQTLSRSVSREPSPQFQGDQYFLQQQQNALQAFTPDLQSHISAHGSRPVSPFEASINAPSPSFTSASITRPGSSPSFLASKPQSPPVLQMPNNAPSPVTLPPIVTQQPTQTANGNQGQGHALVGQVGGMGGLLPPTNPALQHLSGMMGISPIAPNADGPQIFVQPSTPISGLKDGRGHFDAALRRAAQQAQQSRQSHLNQTGEEAQQQFSVPSPNMGSNSQAPPPHQHAQQYQQNAMDFASRMQMQNASGWGNLGNQLGYTRPRAKSDSFAPVGGGMGQADFERQAMAQIMAQAQAMGLASSLGQVEEQAQQQVQRGMEDGGGDWRNNVGAWLNSMGLNGQGQAASYGGGGGDFGGMGDQSPAPPGTVNPNQLPGNDQDEFLRQLEHQHQLSQLQAQRVKMSPLSVNTQTNTGTGSGIFKYEPGEFSPTSMAFYQQRGVLPPSSQFGFGTNSAPYYNTDFQSSQGGQYRSPPNTAPYMPQGFGYLGAGGMNGSAQGSRRQSFNEGSTHHATGAGTPGYGMGFAGGQGQQGISGRVRGVSPSGHRRAAKSEDLGKGGWGLGHGGSTTEFLNSITANDGSLIPPIRGGRTHSRNSSISSGRSASPALSISSHGSSFSYASGSGHGHMDMPDGVDFGEDGGDGDGASNSGVRRVASGSGAGGKQGRARLSKMKVTSMATEAAATNRRTNNGIFQCPVPGCGSTFTRHFNLKGHMRSHNDERPYKCLYDGCPKADVGFARQHDCKRHMLLHQGLRPFECEACHKKFARLDALTRHHKSEQGIECALVCPLPTNPDGSAMSESQYKNYKAAQGLLAPAAAAGGSGKKGRRRAGSNASSGGRSGDEDGAGGSGMEDYDRA